MIPDILVGVGVLIVVWVLVLVLGIQMQVRALTNKMDKILQFLDKGEGGG